MTEKIESIIDNVNLIEEINEAGSAFWATIIDSSLSRRAAFFGCIDILMIYAKQKKWNADQLKDAIGKYIDLHSLEN